QVALDVAGRQAVVHVGDEDLGVASDRQMRVEGVRLGGEADLDLAGWRGGGRSAPAQPCGRGGQAQNAQRGAPGHRSLIHCGSSQAPADVSQAPVTRPLTSTMTLRNVFVPILRSACRSVPWFQRMIAPGVTSIRSTVPSAFGRSTRSPSTTTVV